jgi:hypothetical protein
MREEEEEEEEEFFNHCKNELKNHYKNEAHGNSHAPNPKDAAQNKSAAVPIYIFF